MAVRRLLRGHIPWEDLEAVAIAVLERNGESSGRVEFLDANNWLSVPFVMNDRYFVKVISRQHSRVHGLLTTGRNIGALASGRVGFFDHFDTPLDMAEHELYAAEQMRSVGVNVPEPRSVFEVEGLGVLVFEYIPSFRSLNEVDTETVRMLAPEMFESLDTMHESGLAHGDLRSENVLVSDGDLYFLDATNVGGEIEDARAYDIACALGVLSPVLGPAETVECAEEVVGIDPLVHAEDFLDFVTMRPDLAFDATRVKGEIEKRASQ